LKNLVNNAGWKDLLSTNSQYMSGTYGSNTFSITAVNGAATVDGGALGTSPMVIASVVPEPSSLVLLVAGAVNNSRRRTVLYRGQPAASSQRDVTADLLART
jgi:hypothetical protein